MGKNGDPQTGWMKEEQRGCSFQVATVHNSGVNLYCVRGGVSAFRIIKGPHLRGES